MVMQEVGFDDRTIASAFGGYNFGDEGKTPNGRRKMVLLALMKIQAGYSIGSSMRDVLWRLNLVTEYNKVPTRAAKRLMYLQVKQALAGGREEK